MKIGLVFCALAAAADGPRFEVASVKLSAQQPPVADPGVRTNGGGCPLSMRMDQARLEIQCATLVTLIGYAYRISPDCVSGPAWLNELGATRFQVAAKIPDGVSVKQIPKMLQALLAERFRVLTHSATEARPVYALVAAKSGLRMTPARPSASESEEHASSMAFYGNTIDRQTANPGEAMVTIISNPRMGEVHQTERADGSQRWEANAITLPGVADLVDKVAPLPLAVIDRTGIPGGYRMTLEVAPFATDPQVKAKPRMELEGSVLRAFNNGLRPLGLQLERRRGPVATIVVDRAEKLPVEN